MTYEIVECDNCGYIIGFIQMEKLQMFEFICKECHEAKKKEIEK